MNISRLRMLNYYKSHFLIKPEFLYATAAISGGPVLDADRTIHEFIIRGHLIVQQVQVDGQLLEKGHLCFWVLFQPESIAACGVIRACHARHEATETSSESLA